MKGSNKSKIFLACVIHVVFYESTTTHSRRIQLKCVEKLTRMMRSRGNES